MAIGDSENPNMSEAQEDPTAKYVNTLFKRWMKVCRKQHRAFEDADKFVMGNQWDPEDVSKLNAENRPVAVFNFTKRHINAISGVQILNNLSPQFLARVISSDQAQVFAELASGAHDFVMQCCNGYDEIAAAFRRLTIRGLSFMKMRLDTSRDPDGEIVWEEADGRQIVWDSDARKENMEDSRGYIFFAKIPKREAINEWPEHEDYIKSSDSANFDDVFGTSAKVEQVVPPVYDPINKYETDAIDSSDKDSVILKEAYWYEDEAWTKYVDPFDQQVEPKEMSAADFRAFKKEFTDTFPEQPEPEGATFRKRVYKRAFVIGRRTMEESDAPCQVGFPILAMTGDWDEKEKLYTGLPLGVLKDPQKFLNKYLSQSMHSIATSPKGVLMFEDGAFDNIVMAEEQWASWAPFIPMSEGAMGGPNGQGKKFEYIPPAPAQQIFMEMWKACIDVISQISGISQEILTGGEGEVPGITMRQRQQVAMIAMAGYFKVYRRFLRTEADITLNQVQKFYTDDRIVQIGGSDGYAVRLSEFRDPLMSKYIVVIDDHPYNANTQMAYWEALTQSGILPGLFKTGAIMQMPSLVDAFPLWSAPKREMKKWIGAMAQNLQPGQIPGQKPPQQGKGQQSARNDPQMVQATVAQKGAQAQLAQAKVQETLAKARALDQKSRGDKVQAILDIFAQTLEAEQKKREHEMSLHETAHGIRRANFDSMIGAMGAMGGRGMGAGA